MHARTQTTVISNNYTINNNSTLNNKNNTSYILTYILKFIHHRIYEKAFSILATIYTISTISISISILISTIVFTAFHTATPVNAVSEYEISYNSTYQVLSTNNTRVEHEITLKNNFANIYPTTYTISIGSDRLQNIQVTQNGYKVTPTVKKLENTTNINIPILKPSIGKDKETNIKISYINPDILEHNGNIYTINIPKLSNSNEISKYGRSLIVPNTFPTATISYPKPNSVYSDGGNRVYKWNGKNPESITLLFGKYQLYNFQLQYNITNNDIGTTKTEIAIPPDTEYQEIYINSIDPEPEEIRLDSDGNWMAIYQLKPQEKKTVSVNLIAKVYPTPTINLDIAYSIKNLTQPTKFWQSNSPEIKNLASKLKTPKYIYDYIVENFSYNYNRVNLNSKRLGAKYAIQNPQLAICTEFTDSFIAMARSLGIPAREINGYAYTNNPKLRPINKTSDILHSWPEYLDKTTNTWRQVDPTWGNTTGGIDYFNKLDFNHITFVRHGLEDDYPIPAGAYKKDPKIKTINLTIITKEPRKIENIQINGNTITNLGNTSIRNKQVLVNGENITIKYLQPYGKLTVNTQTSKSNILNSPNNTTMIIVITVVLIITTITTIALYIKLKPTK